MSNSNSINGTQRIDLGYPELSDQHGEERPATHPPSSPAPAEVPSVDGHRRRYLSRERFDEDYPLIYRTAYGCCRHYGLSQTDSEEVTQAVAVDCWLYCPARPDLKLAGYVWESCRRRVVASRQENAHRPTRFLVPEETLPARGLSPEATLLLEERIQELLGKLRPLERRALLMDCDGLSNGEIAQVLGTTPGYVGKLLHQARKRLRED